MPVESKTKTVSVTKATEAGENYSADDVISEAESGGSAWLFSDIVPENGMAGRIIGAHVIAETAALTALTSLYLFKALPTSNLNDNAANTAPRHADLANYVGRIDFGAMDSQGGDAEAIVVEGSGKLPLPFKCSAAANDLWGILVYQASENSEVDGEDMTVRLTRELI